MAVLAFLCDAPGRQVQIPACNQHLGGPASVSTALPTARPPPVPFQAFEDAGVCAAAAAAHVTVGEGEPELLLPLFFLSGWRMERYNRMGNLTDRKLLIE